MNRCHRLFLFWVGLTLLTAAMAEATPSYRSFIEWNGPYYHVRHALSADSNVYLNYTVNNPLPLYSLPFSSPTAVVMYGSPVSQTAFVVDHDHSRVQVFSTDASWQVEVLTYSTTPVQGFFGGRAIKFTRGQVLPASEQILINNRLFTRVSSLTGYTLADSVYSIVYDGVPNTGGVASLPSGWNLGAFDSVRVEYAFANPPGNTGVGELDYVLFQSVPTDIPLQLNEATSATDPAMNDLTAIAINASTRVGSALDLYLVNALPGGDGTLASYDLTTLGAGGVFQHVDTYPGLLGRPYAVKIVDVGPNVAGAMAFGAPSGVDNSRLTLAIRNQNTLLGHDYRITYSFDTTSMMNQSDTPDNKESDIAYDPVTGRLHMVMCRDNAAQGTAYSFSDDYGQTWSAALTISPASLTAAHDRPRIAVRSTGEIHVVYEATNMAGDRHLYHVYSYDGISWSTTTEVTTALTPSTVTENRYANLLVDPATDNVHLIWAGDDDVYHRVFSTSWGGISLVVNGSGTGFSAPHAVMDNVGRIYLAFVSNAAPPCQIGYMVFNGAMWGSYDGGGFTSGTVDPVTNSSGVANDGGGRGEVFPFPQIALTGDSIWIFWIGQGTEVYGTDPCQMHYNRINTPNGDFTLSAGMPITTGDHCAPMRFSVATDADHNLSIVYPYGTTVDREGLRCKTWTCEGDKWLPYATAPGRCIFNAGAAVTVFAYEPRVIVPFIAGQMAPMVSCAKAYTTVGGGSPRIVFKVMDGVLMITDEITLSQFNRWRVWTNGNPDIEMIPGLSITLRNTGDAISNTDNVDATEFNVGDYFELNGTPPVKNDLLFLTDSDNHRVKVIRAYDNIDHCFGGDVRWDVPGKSDGTPSQTYKLATTGGEVTYRVWASPDSLAWTIVDNLLVAGPGDHVCELNRYTHEVRFGDNNHGAIPPAGSFIRVRYQESVDEAEFGRLGNGAGQMTHPRGLAARYNAALGQYDVYTCDAGNDRLQKWSYRPNSSVDPASWTNAIVSWYTASSDTDLLRAPEAVEVVTVYNQVFLVVSDNGNKRLVIYRDDEASGSGGNQAPGFVSTVGGRGSSLNQFMDPRGLAVMVEDTGLVIMAADAQRNQVQKVVKRDWLTGSATDTSGGGGAQNNMTSLTLNDALDGDAYLLLQPGAVRTVELRVAKCDSLMGLHTYATFPANMITILSVSEGNLWSGERFTNKVFLFNYDNAAGYFEINAAMVGDDDGMTTPGSRIVATLVVRADSNMTVPSTGVISLTDSTDLRRAGNQRVTNYTRTNLNLRGGHLADLAAAGADPGSPPHMVPEPDGHIDFADVNVFTMGWNGDGLRSDPIADIGPYLGDTPPALIANPDGRMDAYDLLSLNTMYNWSSSTGPIILPPPSNGKNGRTLDDHGAIAVVARQINGRWSVEIQTRNVTAVTTAHLMLHVNTPNGSISTVQAGDFLGQENTLFLHTERGPSADISMGRLNRESPCASGSGMLAKADLNLPAGATPELRVVYELRDNHNTMIAAGESSDLDMQAIPQAFGLDAPYPNPFNSTTTFTLNLNEAGRATLRVFNVLGQEAATVWDRDLPAGIHRLNWDARDNAGALLPSGVYLTRLETRGHSAVQKIVLLR